MDNYFVKRQSNVFGPVAQQNILDLAKSGKIQPTDKISAERNGPWKPVTSLVPLETGFATGTDATDSLPHKEQQPRQRKKPVKHQQQSQPYPGTRGQRETSNLDPGMLGWYLIAWSKYVQFEGRARRKEYWLFALTNILAGMAISLVAGLLLVMLNAPGISFLYTIYILATILPSTSVLVRRLHDTGRSGWWSWITLVPAVGFIILLILLTEDSEPGSNWYGPNPK